MSSVLLLHSGGLTSRQWRKLADQLSPRYRVIAPDLIGYSGERWPDGEPFHFRQDVERLIPLLDEPAHVVGHSYGGLLALQLALARPELVRSIAVYEPVAFGATDNDPAIYDALGQLGSYRLDEPDVWLEGFIDWWQGVGAWRRLPPAAQQTFRDVGWKVSEEVASLSADQTSRARYATISAPTLLLAGETTNPAELHVVQVLAEALPRATMQVFPGIGHMGPITHAAPINAAIAAFLDDADRN